LHLGLQCDERDGADRGSCLPACQEAVLLLQERVGEAQRLATVLMRETDKNKKGKRKGAHDDADDAGQMFKKKYGKR